MHGFVFVSMYVCVSCESYRQIYIHTYVHVYMYTCIYMHSCTCVCARALVCVRDVFLWIYVVVASIESQSESRYKNSQHTGTNRKESSKK